MIRKQTIVSIAAWAGGLVALFGLWLPLNAEPASTQPSATTRPASTDPNLIAMGSWERRFTIPTFVETPRGLEPKTTTSRPAPAATRTLSFRSTRSSSSTGTSGSSRASSSSRSRGYGEEGYSERSSRSSRSERRSERSSRRSSRSSRGGY
ncbi:MAG: hypothetical protein HY718_17625 [Planctomycetes bacterium]|nr:hypothetical protein [Planctomycetota bacterium]